MTRRLWSTVFFLGVLATLTWAQVRPIVTPGGGGSGAPADATYITQTANGSLSNEQALGALATGLLKSTTTTGVLSIATGADLPWPITAPAGGAIRTGTADTNSLLLQAYDVDGAGWVDMLRLVAGNTPGMTGVFANGTAASPSILFAGDTNTGFILVEDNLLGFVASGGIYAGLAAEAWLLRNNTRLEWRDGTALNSGQSDVRLGREAAAILQLGLDVNGAAVGQTLKSHDGITGTDIAGANFTLAAGRGTGAGAPGTLILQTATALASGTTAQTLATRLIIGATGAATLGTTAGTGAGAFYAGSYFVGTTAGCSGATATAFTNGLATTCGADPVPDPLTQTEVNELRGLLSQMRPKQ